MKHAYQRWLIKASIIHMSIGVFIGLFMYLAPLVSWQMPLVSMRSVHIHELLFGGVLQMIMGVALWMFPRMKKAPHYTSTRKGVFLFVILNAGVVMRSTFEMLGTSHHHYYLFALLGVVLQVCAVLFFLGLIMQRIRKP